MVKLERLRRCEVFGSRSTPSPRSTPYLGFVSMDASSLNLFLRFSPRFNPLHHPLKCLLSWIQWVMPTWMFGRVYITRGVVVEALWCRFVGSSKLKGRFTLRWWRLPVGQECLAKTWLYEANGGCAGEELKVIKYFYWVGLLRTWNSFSREAQLQKVPPRRRPCYFIIHEKNSPPLFSSPSIKIHRSRVAFSTNHNWETPFFSWPVDFSTVV